MKLQSLVDENIATAIPYPKIKKTVPQFLTIDEYNKIVSHCRQKADTWPGIRREVLFACPLSLSFVFALRSCILRRPLKPWFRL